MIIGYDESTFGTRKKIISTTIVFVKCDHCLAKEWKTIWNNRKKRDHDYCISCMNILGIHGMKGKKHSFATKQKFKNRNLGESNPSKREDVRKKISEKLKGRKCEWLVGKKRPKHSKKMKKYMLEVWDEKNEQYAEQRKRLKAAVKNNVILMRKASLLLGRVSKLQKRIKEEIVKNNINGFISEVPIGKYVVDECNKNKLMIIEIFGDYWHANPKHYKSREKIKYPYGTKTAKNIWERDKKRLQDLKLLGYKVFIIWESEWKQDFNLVIKKLKGFLNDN